MRRHLWVLVIIVGAVLAAYSNTLRNGFIGDDHIYIEQNPFTRDPSNLKFLLNPRFYLGTQEVLLGSRPVFLGSLLLDRALWGANPAGYHATNMLIHAANSALVYGLACALALAPPVPLFAGLFFGLNPVQTEAVDAVSFRPDLLAAFFVFLALGLYLKARRSKPALALPLLAASAAFYGFGLLSKEMAVTLPLMVLLVEFYFPEEDGRRLRVAGALPAYGLVLCAYAGFWAPRFRYNGTQTASSLRSALDRFAYAMPSAPSPSGLGFGLQKAHIYAPSSWQWSGLFANRQAAILTMIKAIAEYFVLLLFPYQLVVSRAPAVVLGWMQGGVLLCLALLLLIACYALWARRRDPASAFGAAWFFAALLPVSNIIPLYNPVAERYLYLVTVGAALAAACALAGLARRPGLRQKQTALMIGGLIAVACGVRTYARNLDWQSDRTLYLETPGNLPQDSRASFTRAGLLQQDGRFADAAAEYERAARLDPNFPEAWMGLGDCYGAMKDTAAAAADYDKALSLAPQNATLPFSYAVMLTRIGRPERAISMYRQALKLEPKYVEAWVNLGALYRDASRYAQAKECYTAALSLAVPGDGLPHYSYGTLLEKKGDIEGAIGQYRSALEQDSSLLPAHMGLARLYTRLGRKREAAQEYGIATTRIVSGPP